MSCRVCGSPAPEGRFTCGRYDCGVASMAIGARVDAVAVDEVETYRLAREAADRAALYADEGCIENGWEVGGGLWDDEASDHLYENREELDGKAYALARELLAERRRDRCRK